MFHSASFLYSRAKAQRTYLVCRPAEHRLYSLTPCLSCLAGYDLSVRNTASLPGGLQGKAADKRLSHSISSSYPSPKLGKHSASAQSYITSLPPWLRHKKNSDSLEPASSNSGSLRWRSEERRKGRDNKSFLILSLGRMRNNKAPSSVLSVIQKCCMFHWALEAHKQQHTAHTGKKNDLEKWQEEEKNWTVLVQFLSLILHGHSLFMFSNTQMARTQQITVRYTGKNKDR